ncbi:LOW QUALITY PROTEIN: uncharacterized protein LOC143292252 [Babylonia areolata]|uniref:LOW QUALITY PROTEIN: uncharacterized protein LOC143292252 n=1 Tax=Babylonia areolata TaxID=304850 RepID=UPI003FD36739
MCFFYSEKLPDHQVNGLKSPGFSSSARTGIWSPGLSPSSVKSEPVGIKAPPAQQQSSPPGSSLKNIAPVWKPSGSPGGARKEFRPVRLNTSAIAKPAERKAQQVTRGSISHIMSHCFRPRNSCHSASGLPLALALALSGPPSRRRATHGSPHAPRPPQPPLNPRASLVLVLVPVVAGAAAPPPVSSLKYTPPPMSTTATSSALFSPGGGSSSRPADGWERGGGGRAGGDRQHSRTNGSVSDSVFDGPAATARDDEVRLPSTQSPYITLLQKSRENETQGDLNFSHISSKKPIMVSSEGQLPRGAQYLGEKVTVEGDRQHTDTFYATPSQEVTTTSRKVEQKPVVYDGIGPVDKEGVPLAFRKNVQEEKQHDWYKQMYRSLHKTDKKEDRLGINDMIDSIFEKAVRDLEENTYRPTYKFPDDISDTKSEEDFNPYRPAYERSSSAKDESGYRSEPEGRYKDLFRRHKSASEREPREPRRNAGSYWSPANVKSRIEVYRNQPRSIMDYEPGYSSIAIREAKTRRPRSYSAHSLRERKRKNKGNQFNPPIDKPGQLSQYSLGGVRSPSEPDIRQDGDGADPRDIYKRVQSGGDIPAKGLQKPAPEKPREEPAPPPPPPPPSSQSSSATFPRKTAARQAAQQGGGDRGGKQWGSHPTPRTPSSSTATLGPATGGPPAPTPPTRGGGSEGGAGGGGRTVRGAGTLPLPRTKHFLPSGGSGSLSAAEQLGVKSPPPPSSSSSGFVSGGVSGSSGTSSLSATTTTNPFPSAAFKHQTSDERRPRPEPVNPEKERRRKEEEEAYRKKRLEELYEEERLKKMKRDEADAEARRHHDFYTNAQKSPISPNRFDDAVNSLSPTSTPVSGHIGAKGPQLSVPPERRRGFQIQGKARALFNFTAQNPRELSFRKNDIIFLLRQVDKNWFEGEKFGVVGIFPTNYVEVVTSIEAAQAAAMQAEGQGRAKYNFTAQSSVELSLRKGEFVVLLRRVDENWYEGRIGNRQGIFPVSYVEITREPSTPLITPAPSVITTPMTGTPEMLSPVGYDAAPTPPPQPSPSALTAQRSPYGYPQPGYSPFGGSGSLLTPATSMPRQGPSRQDQDFGGGPRSPISNPKSPVSPGRPMGSPGRRPSPGPSPGSMSKLQVDIQSTAKPLPNGPPASSAPKVMDDDLALTRYRALYAYRPQNEDELELREGDEVFVMEKCDDGWFVGTSARTGCFGTFPGNYVQKI